MIFGYGTGGKPQCGIRKCVFNSADGAEKFRKLERKVRVLQ